MLTQLDVYTPRVFTPPFGLNSSINTDLIQIRNIDGLGPVAANITSTPFAQIDGESYSGANVGKRNIVLTLGLNSDWYEYTVSDLRSHVYTYFMPKNEVTLKFTRQRLPVCEITGIVESVEPNLFTDDPELIVSILCNDPYFTDVTETVLVGGSRLFSNATRTAINYTGTVPTGVNLVVQRSSSNYTANPLTFSNYNVDSEDITIQQVEVTSVYDLKLQTIMGAKYARRITKAAGTYTNVLGKVLDGSVWPQLYPGDNQISVQANVTTLNWTLTYKNRYGGL